MSRIEAKFASLQAAKRKALIPYVTAGFPVPATTVPMLHALVEAGCDILEIGVPFQIRWPTGLRSSVRPKPR